jgi:hypothetical protein
MTKLITGVALAVLVTVLTPAPTGAQFTNDKLAFLTFSGSVQVPGATLPAGTYRFHLTDLVQRNVIQVMSNDAKIVYSQFLTRPDRRTVVTDDEAAVTFLETPAGVPPAIKSLFYDGEYRGYEFVWGKGEPNMIAKEVAQPPITYTAIAPAAPAPMPAPAIRRAPEVTVEQGVAPPALPAPVELPRTATPLAFLAVGGLGSMLAGLLLRRK